LNCRYKDYIFYKCEDREKKCHGAWKIKAEEPDQEGMMHKPHSIGLEQHSYYREAPDEAMSQAVSAKAPVSSSGSKAEFQELQTIVSLILRDRPELQKDQLVDRIREIKPNLTAFIESNETALKNVIASVQTKMQLESQGLIEASEIKTLRNTDYGRKVLEFYVGGKKYYSYFFTSADFEIRVLKENKGQEQHALIETQVILESPALWKLHLTISIFDHTMRQFMPIGEVLS